ncbi:MAG: bifunctional homocysteine S-methyltransferase/methylenetetrahydrofolate reductase [Oligoflexales bacterium]
MRSLRETIESRSAILADGAIGTELYNRGIFINKCFEDANLNNPNLVRTLHQEYHDAGAMLLSTNSWGANTFKLQQHNLQEHVYEINKKAAELARDVCKAESWVAGAVGPLGVRIEPWGPTSFEAARKAFRDQVQALLDGGVDAIALETFSDLSELQQAVLATRDVSSDIPLIAYVTIDMGGRSAYGTPGEWFVKKLDEWPVDVVGLNCSVGPQPMISCLEKLQTLTTKPFAVRPNAGLPRAVDGRQIYMATPEYMARFTHEFFDNGVLIVGGCCGTSPTHVKAMAQEVRHVKALSLREPRYEVSEPEAQVEVSRIAAIEKSRWARKIANGEQVCSVELLPPQGIDPSKVIESSRALKKADVDAINIPDGPRATARMSAVLTAVMIEQQAEIETVLHYTCRDRNLVGMQSDLLGAQAVGLRNLLLVTGDPPKMGSYPNATGVFDVDAIGLTNMANRLNGGSDLGGQPIGSPCALSLGVGANPVHRDIEFELKRFEWKVKAGAEWAITQPVFDAEALYRFIDEIDKRNVHIPIVAGIWPLVSYRNATFMNNEVPGVEIPQTIIERMGRYKDAESARKEGVDIACEMVEAMKKTIQGVQVSAPFGRIDLALKVIGKS